MSHRISADLIVRTCNSWVAPTLLIFLSVSTAVGQAPPPNNQPKTPGPQAAPARAGVVEAMLVKNALTAVNHANITGNFTVLRDLGSTSFRQKNSAGDLAAIFKSLRDKKIDLSPVLMLEPQFMQQPAVDQAGYLQLVGFFPTRPLQVKFALAFQRVEAGWMIDTISVGAVEAVPPQATAANTPPANAQQVSHTGSASPAGATNNAAPASGPGYTFPARAPAANAGPTSAAPSYAPPGGNPAGSQAATPSSRLPPATKR